MHTRRRPCADRGRDWVVFYRRGVPMMASKPPEANGGAWGRSSVTVLRRNQPCGHLDLRLSVSRTGSRYISAVLSCPLVICCYGSLRRLIPAGTGFRAAENPLIALSLYGSRCTDTVSCLGGKGWEVGWWTGTDFPVLGKRQGAESRHGGGLSYLLLFISVFTTSAITDLRHTYLYQTPS